MTRRFIVVFAMALAAGPAPAQSAHPSSPSFRYDIIPLLTKAGCNQGTCHGKGAGQNGFRLSLRGYAPDWDHKWITREFDGRRLSPADPEGSLLLRKATGQVPHEGGRVIVKGGPEYRLLQAWIAAGCPGPRADEPALSRLEVAPAAVQLRPSESVRLVATATFADGSTRDVTHLTKFESADPAGLEVTADGTVTARRPGTAAVRASFLTEVAICTVSVPFDRRVDEARFRGGHNLIDTHVFARLNELRIEPSDPCTDEAFIRRLFLDACGILPPAEEVARFLADPDPHKRARLVDAVLARPEFTDYWTHWLAELLQNRKERDHDVRGTKGVRQFHAWLRRQVAANRPWDALARDVLTASGSSIENPAVGYYIVTVGEHRHGERSEAPESVALAFLGTRIGCARCHNHPLERYTQDDYHHFAAFFSRIRLERREAKAGPTVLHVGHPDARQNAAPVGVVQPRTGQFLPPRPLDRSAVTVRPGDDPRVALADWVTRPDNELFAGAMVNRVWKHYLGVGLVEPVDDLRATNPPSNPALWHALIGFFRDSGYDLRALMRLILTSQTYQLSSTTRAGNATDTRFYSHYYARRLPAEVLLDAICDVTGIPERFDGYPLGVRAVQVPDPAAHCYFLTLFGRSERVTACACERSAEVNLAQVLHLIAGAVTGRVNSSQCWVNQALATEPDDNKLLDALFLRALARRATDSERRTVRALLAEPDANREAVYRDLLWAVLNSKEFLFNH